ncbi:3-oxoacyl-ACP reductase [Liquorilactobacillus vini]|uniref:3-oxoacyl-[acyl-carrier-protein] reductase n=1 Tax=Liquorilactobacillus vini DSM 20605 TaxID=1133569 RepID=A0A0R2CDE4_9LACO|nr:3-oxoacyl-ACP reductase [Liquorilactobacillus vini]KRM89365.1 3-oxoacyl-[acyl-carrier-protein] reductase [Liquorilactobacillus vini DSM 20605]
MSQFSEFKDQKIVITGVASGIGAAQAQAFLQHQAIVWGLDQKSSTLVKTFQKTYPQQFHFLNCDVSQAAAIKSAAKEILADGAVKILLNTAGILDAYRPTLKTTEQLWDQILDTDLKSVFRLTNQFLPAMLAQGQGVIINMASIAGLVAGGGGAAYTAAKHAIIGYTKQLDYDYAVAGIRANCLAPGAIQTPMNQADFAGDQAMAKAVARQTPAQRWAQPNEVAAATLFLASRAADYIHGVVLPIDGGWLEK